MSNVLKVSLQETIQSLTERKWSQRRIARELAIDRETVGRYVRLGSKPAISTTGSAGNDRVAPAISRTGLPEGCRAKPAISTAGKAGRRSVCEPMAEVIGAKVELGLSAQRIYQDLVGEHGFAESYQSVKRFVRKLRESDPKRIWRMECEPGEEAQIDFGLGAPIDDGSRRGGRRSWVLRVVLSWSRKAYSEAVLRQDSETFLRALENAFRSFGGVPFTLNVDNLKAAVLKADWYDPEINPKLAEFCRHYGTHVLPCRPYTPQHKGKVERGVAYVRGNALKGRRFRSLAEENIHLLEWERTVADQRLHGTTRQQVGASFEEEKPHLRALPDSLFPCFQEAQRSVHRDSYVEVAKAYYEAPPEYIGRQLWVRWDARTVRLFNERMEQVRIHARIEPGRFSRSLGAGGLSAPVRHSCRYWESRAALLGDHCGSWAQTAFEERGPEALRSVMGLCNLIRTHSGSALDTACASAMRSGTRRLKDIRRLLGENATQSELGFAQEHPLIRDLTIYSAFVDEHKTQPSHDQHTANPCTQTPPFRAA